MSVFAKRRHFLPPERRNQLNLLHYYSTATQRGAIQSDCFLSCRSSQKAPVRHITHLHLTTLYIYTYINSTNWLIYFKTFNWYNELGTKADFTSGLGPTEWVYRWSIIIGFLEATSLMSSKEMAFAYPNPPLNYKLENYY